MPERRFPPPWSVEETDACFIVRDANGQALAYLYFEGGAGTPFPPFERPWSLWQNKDDRAAFIQWRQCKPRVGGKWPQVTRAESAADYRRFAAECLHLAEQYPISKATLIAMAAAWQRMAEFADRMETLEPFPDDPDHSKF